MTNSSKLYLVNINFWPHIDLNLSTFSIFAEKNVFHKALTCPWTNMVLWRGQMGTPVRLGGLGS